MKLLVINGPNMNLLGVREPEIYGKTTYKDLVALISSHCEKNGVEAEFFQSNHEGAIVDKIQDCLTSYDGLIINPAAYTHTSVAIPDAIKATGVKAVEVHISDTDSREPFRKISYVSPACVATIKGKGIEGYLEAVDILINSVC